MKPVHKKGDKLLTYMPISLLTSFSKIFEKLIYSRLYKHIHTNNLPAKEKYGFGINSSTQAASYDAINQILKAVNNRLSVGGIFCDLEKAFYCINHETLVDKLQFYGIKGKFLASIQSYLRGRYQKVLIDKFNAYAHCCWTFVQQSVSLGEETSGNCWAWDPDCTVVGTIYPTWIFPEAQWRVRNGTALCHGAGTCHVTSFPSFCFEWLFKGMLRCHNIQQH